MPAVVSAPRDASLFGLIEQADSMTRIVNRAVAETASYGAAVPVPKLMRTDSIEAGTLLSPVSSSIFSGSIEDEVDIDGELKICYKAMITSPIIGSCSLEADGTEDWYMNLSYVCPDNFSVQTPRRTFKDINQSFKCRYISASVPRNIDKCTLSAS